MDIEKLKYKFSVCKVKYYPQDVLDGDFCFIGQTDEEKSLVCLSEKAPKNASEISDGWRAFRICGVLDFSLVGILAKISAILAEEKIGIFAVSTYNTDYVFVKEENFERGLAVLADRGYNVIG